MLLFQGCRVKETLPAPEAPLNPTIEKIKAWYNPKIERLKGQKSTGTDIYYPQWEQGLIHNLPNGEKVVVFPVHIHKKVDYDEIGFVRRFAVLLSSADSIKNVKILEMVGSKEYLQTQKESIARNYYLSHTVPQEIRLWQKTISLYQEKSSFIGTGTGTGSTGCTALYATLSIDPYTCEVTITTNCGSASAGYAENCPGSGSSNIGWVGGNPSTGTPAWGIGVGAEPNGNVPIYTEYPPCLTCPLSTSLDLGDNTLPQPDPPQLKPSYLHTAFDAILHKSSLAEAEGWQEMNREFTKVHDASNLMKLLIGNVKNKKRPILVHAYKKIPDASGAVSFGSTALATFNDNNQPTPGIHIRITKPIFLKANEGMISSVLFEEIFHGLQLANEDSLGASPSSSNREFEVKVFLDIVNLLNGEKLFKTFPIAFDGNRNPKYRAWLMKITKEGTELPDFDDLAVLNGFTEDRLPSFIQYWDEKGHPNYGAPKSNHKPFTLIKLFKAAKQLNYKN